MSTNSHDTVPLPYLPEGGASFAPPSTARNPSAVISTRTLARTSATCGLVEAGAIISGMASGNKAVVGNRALTDGNMEDGINAKLALQGAEMDKSETPGKAGLIHGTVMPILVMITPKNTTKNTMETRKRTNGLKRIAGSHTHRRPPGDLSMRLICGMTDAEKRHSGYQFPWRRRSPNRY